MPFLCLFFFAFGFGSCDAASDPSAASPPAPLSSDDPCSPPSSLASSTDEEVASGPSASSDARCLFSSAATAACQLMSGASISAAMWRWRLLSAFASACALAQPTGASLPPEPDPPPLLSSSLVTYESSTSV